MTNRISPEDNKRVVISKADFNKDWALGYATVEYQPESVKVHRDHRTGREVKIPIPAVINYCCMRCAFSHTMPLAMTKHQQMQEHKWPFDPFSNPYGHIADVVIEGIDDNDETGVNYNEYLKEKSR